MVNFSSEKWFSESSFYPYEISSSCRFNTSQSSCMEKTFSGAGNRKVFTFSTWVKLASGSNSKSFFTAGADAQNKTECGMQSGALRFENEVSNDRDLKDTKAILKDRSAWYHLVYAIDLTQSTNNDKVKMYINGVLQTEFGSEDDTFANVDSNINAAATHYIGKRGYNGTRYHDGYMAETHFIDGTQLTADSFGEEKEDVWIPKKYTGSYGTNGFYLKFDQTGSGTPSASTRGADSSGNGHHFTTSAVNAADCNRPDTPTNNFCTMNPLALSNTGAADFSIGDTLITLADNEEAFGSFGVSSGKWYWEVDHQSSASSNDKLGIGIADADNPNNNEQVNYGHQATTWGVGDIIGVAVNVDDEEITFYKNNTAIETDTDWSSKGWTTIVPFLTSANSAGNEVAMINFGGDSSFNTNKTAQGNTDENGHGDFYYTPPSGFLALCAKNLPEPTISPFGNENPSDYQLTKRWTGSGSEKSITTTFQPDWVWIKHRDGTKDHRLFDSVRGANKRLSSQATSAETDMTQGLKSFDSTGFTLGTAASVNTSSDTYVGWAWKAGTAFSNDASATGVGTIDSTGSVSTKAGFSIISYTGTGSNGTVAHGLEAVPKMIIVKGRTNTYDWIVWHNTFNASERLRLNTTDDKEAGNWNTLPTSSVFGLGTHLNINQSGDDFIAYVFAEVESYSKYGSYSGNGSSNGPFIFTGFRPAWLMVKRTDSTTSWYIYDNKRDNINLAGTLLQADNDAAEAESTTNAFDFYSNGFKARGTGGTVNASGGTFIYMAFAEMPFKYANGR